MLAKLSSWSTISAASFATSVPAMPIAIPMFARESAGASFTPSPVIATISPCSWSDDTILIFCSGVTREKIEAWAEASASCSSSKAVSALPFTGAMPPSVMFSSRPIASAVYCWSPVIIFTRIPARWQTAMASFTSALGGSMMPTRPRKMKLDSTVLMSSISSSSSRRRAHNAMTRMACPAMSLFAWEASSKSDSSMGTISPSLIFQSTKET